MQMFGMYKFRLESSQEIMVCSESVLSEGTLVFASLPTPDGIEYEDARHRSVDFAAEGQKALCRPPLYQGNRGEFQGVPGSASYAAIWAGGGMLMRSPTQPKLKYFGVVYCF